jgi:cell division septal protein FtsQ
MAKREKKRTRKIKKIKPRRKYLPILKIIARLLPYIIFAGILFLFFRATQNFLLYSDYFNIREIKIVGEGPGQTKLSILKGLQSRKNTNIFMQDIKECEYAIERLHPELKDIVVYRSLPDTLLVSYEARKPICQVSSGYYYLVCDDGMIISQPQPSKDPGLIVVAGISIPSRKPFIEDPALKKQLQRAVDIIKDINENYHLSGNHRIVEVYVYDTENPALFLEDRTKIELGRHKFRDKSEDIKKVINELEHRNRKAKVIDLRFEDVVVVPR